MARGRNIWLARHIFWLLAVYAGEHGDLKPLVMSMKPECRVYAVFFCLANAARLGRDSPPLLQPVLYSLFISAEA